MKAELLADPGVMRASGSVAGQFVAAMAERGTMPFIANVASTMLLARIGGFELPVSVDDGGYGRSYVSSPHSAYVPYARREMDLVGLRHGRRAAGAVLSLTDRLLRAARFDRVVHVDNWLLSTNLHGDWQGEGLPELRELLCTCYPDHFVILRTLDRWSTPALMQVARRDGWIMVPARQIWVTDDLARDWCVVPAADGHPGAVHHARRVPSALVGSGMGRGGDPPSPPQAPRPPGSTPVGESSRRSVRSASGPVASFSFRAAPDGRVAGEVLAWRRG